MGDHCDGSEVCPELSPDEILYHARVDKRPILNQYVQIISASHNCDPADTLNAASEKVSKNSVFHNAAANRHVGS